MVLHYQLVVFPFKKTPKRVEAYFQIAKIRQENIFVFRHLFPLNLTFGLASFLDFGTYLKPSQQPPLHAPLPPISSRNSTAGPRSGGSAAPNSCSRVLQQKTTTWKELVGELRGNVTLDEERTKGRDGLSQWTRG